MAVLLTGEILDEIRTKGEEMEMGYYFRLGPDIYIRITNPEEEIPEAGRGGIEERVDDSGTYEVLNDPTMMQFISDFHDPSRIKETRGYLLPILVPRGFMLLTAQRDFFRRIPEEFQ